MSTTRISERQLELLRLLARQTMPVEWSYFWDSWTWCDQDGSSFNMRNFDRVADALVRKELASVDADGLVTITERGQLAVRMSNSGILRTSS